MPHPKANELATPSPPSGVKARDFKPHRRPCGARIDGAIPQDKTCGSFLEIGFRRNSVRKKLACRFASKGKHMLFAMANESNEMKDDAFEGSALTRDNRRRLQSLVANHEPSFEQEGNSCQFDCGRWLYSSSTRTIFFLHTRLTNSHAPQRSKSERPFLHARQTPRGGG
jgi:hypothetical protein